jgi:hypothetical protein
LRHKLRNDIIEYNPARIATGVASRPASYNDEEHGERGKNNESGRELM